MADVANSTIGNAVYREDGTRLFGLDAELERKAQEKRDPEWEKKLLEWIEMVVGQKAETTNLGDALKSGVLLCKVINAIIPGKIKRIDTRPIALVYVENVNFYLKACWDLGIPNSDLFIASDLISKKGMSQVTQNLWSLIRLAQSNSGWKHPLFEGTQTVATPGSSKPTAKKWEPVQTGAKLKTVLEMEIEQQQQRERDHKGQAPGSAASPDLSNQKIVELSNELASIKKEISTSQAQLSSEISEKKQILNRNSQLTKELNQSIANVHNLEVKNRELDNKVQDQARQIQVLRQENAKGSEKTSQSSAEDQQLVQKLLDTIAKLEKEVYEEKTSKSKVETKYKQLLSKYEHQQKIMQSQHEMQADFKELQTATLNYNRLTLAVRKNDKESSNIDMEQMRNMQLLHNIIARIFDSSNLSDVTLKECDDISPTLEQELGRRHFIKLLHSMLKKSPGTVVSETNFESLLYLLNVTLSKMDQNNPDFIMAKQIMKCSRSICKKDPTKGELFMEPFIKEHAVWKNIKFWIEYFFSELYKKYRRYFSEQASVDVDFILTLCSSMMLKMNEWGVAEDTVKAVFLKQVLYDESVALPQPKEVEDELLSFINKDEKKAQPQAQPSPAQTAPGQAARKTVTDEKAKSRGFSISAVLSKSEQSFLSQQAEIIKQGPLVKKGQNRRNWKQRWFVLQSDMLYYLKDQKDKKPQGSIPINDKTVVNASTKKPFCFVISSTAIDSREYYVSAANEAEQKQWIEAIHSVINTWKAKRPASSISNRTLLTQAISTTMAMAQASTTAVPAATSVPATSPPTQAKASEAKSASTTDSKPRTQTQAEPQKTQTPAAQPQATTPQPAPQAQTAPAKAQPAPQPAAPAKPEWYAEALFEYTADSPKELTFVEGDIITVVRSDDSGWWKGELKGKQGWFPTSYVKIVDLRKLHSEE